nr:MAG TPA: hypothetical protein [Caudoviricetes sp.]
MAYLLETISYPRVFPNNHKGYPLLRSPSRLAIGCQVVIRVFPH